MHSGRAAFDQAAGLAQGVLDADIRHPFRVAGGHHLGDQILGQIDVEVAGQIGQQALAVDDLQARDDGNVYPRGPASFHEIEVLRVVEEHLGDDVFGAGVDLGLEIRDVEVQARGLEMLFGIAGDPDAEAGRLSAVELVQVAAGIHLLHLAHHVHRILVALSRPDRLPVGMIAADGQQVVDVEERQFDQRVLGLLAGETVAEQMWHRLHVVPIFQGRAQAQRAGALTGDVPGERAVAQLLEPRIGGVIGHVDESRPIRQQRLQLLVDVGYTGAAFRWRQLEADERIPRFGQEIADAHVESFGL